MSRVRELDLLNVVGSSDGGFYAEVSKPLAASLP